MSLGRKVRGWLIELRELLETIVETKIKHLVGTILVGFSVFGLLLYMVEGNGARDLERESRSAEQTSYQAALRVYDTQVVQSVQCNARYESRKSQRELFIAQNETVRRILALIAGSNAERPDMLEALFVELDSQDAMIGSTYPADETNGCPLLPQLPLVPDSLRGSDQDETGEHSTTSTT